MPRPITLIKPDGPSVSAAQPSATAASRLSLAITERLRERERDVEALEKRYGSIGAVADYLLADLPEQNPWNEKIGPFRDQASVRRYLGIRSRQTIDERVKTGTLLCVKAGDGHLMFPSFQFDEARASLPGLRHVLDAFDEDRKNAWTVALWLAQPDPDLGGRTPAQALRGPDADFALELARRAGAAVTA